MFAIKHLGRYVVALPRKATQGCLMSEHKGMAMLFETEEEARQAITTTRERQRNAGLRTYQRMGGAVVPA